MKIAIAGPKGVGKTTASNHLVNRGFTLINFADSLKIMLQIIAGLNHDQLYGNLKEVIDPKHGKAPRLMMQEFSDLVKQYFGDDIFVDIACRNLAEKCVIGDLRYPNEAEAIKKHNGYIIIIERDILENEYSNHSSETSINQIIRDSRVFVVQNNGSIEELYARIDAIIDSL